MSNEICVKEVIVSMIERRGSGKVESPVRRITQVFEKDGTLIAENDPCPDAKFVAFDLVHFGRWCASEGINVPHIDDVRKWIKETETPTSK